MKWHEYFIQMAELVASKSKDPSTKVGAVIVGEDNEILSTGFNGFPRGVEETKPVPRAWLIADGCREELNGRWQRPQKYLFVEHAERNAIYNAARNGVRLKGATMYLNFEPCPCNECAKAVIQSGIARVVGPDKPFPGKGEQWKESLHISGLMLKEAGVKRLVVT